MVKNIRKIISKVIIVVITIVTATASVSAYSPASVLPRSNSNSPWGIFIDRGYFSSGGILSELDTTDWGVTFICQMYNNGCQSSFYAYAKISDRSLCEYYDSGAKLDYIGDKGTDIFKSGWYDMCGGKVDYTVQAHNYTMGCDQYIAGVAVGTSNPNYS